MNNKSDFAAKRILLRIVLPFILLFFVISLSSWFFSTCLIRRYLDGNFQRQMVRVAGVISRSSYVLNPVIFRQIKDVVQADIVLFDVQGHLLNSTLDEEIDKELLKEIAVNSGSGETVKKNIKLQGKIYNTVIHPVVVPGRGNAFLSLWMPVNKAEQLQRQIFQSTGRLAFFGLLAMIILGYLIARTITRPLEELAVVTGKIAEGDYSRRAIVHRNDEIGSLAHDFNRMINRIQEYEKRLVESEKMATAGQMAAGLAHEIRNPLTSIKMFVQVLHGRLADQAENQAMIDSLLQEIRRLERIINQIVERARPGDFNFRQGNINDHLKEVLRIAAPTLSAANITLDCHLSPALPMVSYDAAKLKQVFWNLLLNSRDAMPKGGTLEISTVTVNNNLKIIFSDSGSGLSDDPERFFAPFYTTKPEGMGLGLSTSRKIIARHGGRLLLANGPEGGAVAAIILPLERKNNE